MADDATAWRQDPGSGQCHCLHTWAGSPSRKESTQLSPLRKMSYPTQGEDSGNRAILSFPQVKNVKEGTLELSPTPHLEPETKVHLLACALRAWVHLRPRPLQHWNNLNEYFIWKAYQHCLFPFHDPCPKGQPAVVYPLTPLFSVLPLLQS